MYCTCILTHREVASIDVVSAVFVRAELDSTVVIGEDIIVSILGSVEREVGHIGRELGSHVY